jgi:hypothetical protein
MGNSFPEAWSLCSLYLYSRKNNTGFRLKNPRIYFFANPYVIHRGSKPVMGLTCQIGFVDGMGCRFDRCPKRRENGKPPQGKKLKNGTVIAAQIIGYRCAGIAPRAKKGRRMILWQVRK